MESAEQFKGEMVRVGIDSIKDYFNNNIVHRLCGRNVEVWFSLDKDHSFCSGYNYTVCFKLNDAYTIAVQVIVEKCKDVYEILREYGRVISEFIDNCEGIVKVIELAIMKADKLNRKDLGEAYANSSTRIVELL